MSKDSVFYSNLNFVNDKYGWMKISKWIGPYSDYGYYLYKTNNGGKIWHQVNNPPDSAFDIFTFVDSLSGFSGGENQIYGTNDGGQTWVKRNIDREVEQILSGDTIHYNASFSLVDIYFVDEQHGWWLFRSNRTPIPEAFGHFLIVLFSLFEITPKCPNGEANF